MVPKIIRLNFVYYFIMKIPNKRDFQQTAVNHSLDIDFKDFTNLYKTCTAKPYYFNWKWKQLKIKKHGKQLTQINVLDKNYDFYTDDSEKYYRSI